MNRIIESVGKNILFLGIFQYPFSYQNIVYNQAFKTLIVTEICYDRK